MRKMSYIKKIKVPKLSKSAFTMRHSTGIVFALVVFTMSKALSSYEILETFINSQSTFTCSKSTIETLEK